MKMSETTIKRVLLVDDYDMTRALLKIILHSDHFEVVGEASNGEQALSMFSKVKPDIILLDVVMPKMNGLQTLIKLKEMGFAGMIFMLTNESEREVVEQAMKLGANGFIAKPFNAHSIMEVLLKEHDKFVLQAAGSFKPR
jgi:YesN/AraC family two-component response regulator